jgi:hypothetical protein
VTEATVRLKMILIPWVASNLDQLHGLNAKNCSFSLNFQKNKGSRETVSFFSLTHLHRVLHVVHALGVNFRFLLSVRHRSHNVVTMSLLLCEVASRQIKKMLRKLLRSTLASANGIHDVQVAKNVVKFCNNVFSESKVADVIEETAQVWEQIAEGKSKIYLLKGADCL